MQCTNVGILRSDPGRVCCLTYYDEHKESKSASFFKGTCKRFLCNAWNELTDRQVLFSAELMKDWYYYSLLLNSPELIADLCAEYESPNDIPAKVLEKLKTELESNLKENAFF